MQQPVYTLLLEWLPAAYRGRVGTVSGVFWGVGTCLINLVAWANYVPGPD
jgi:hypothetical protein